MKMIIKECLEKLRLGQRSNHPDFVPPHTTSRGLVAPYHMALVQVHVESTESILSLTGVTVTWSWSVGPGDPQMSRG